MHILGMWVQFPFSAGLITYFVVRMASMLRQQEARAVAQREDRLRNDQIMAVASLAAGTAHELGNTAGQPMTVLIDEMLQMAPGQAGPEDCELLQAQLGQCKSTLKAPDPHGRGDLSAANLAPPLGQFVRETLERWTVRRPGVVCTLLRPGEEGIGPLLEYDSTPVPGHREPAQQRRGYRDRPH